MQINLALFKVSQNNDRLITPLSLGQGAAVSVKRLLPTIPRLGAIGGRHQNRLSFDVSSGAELLERRLQDTLVVNESLFQRSKGLLRFVLRNSEKTSGLTTAGVFLTHAEIPKTKRAACI